MGESRNNGTLTAIQRKKRDGASWAVERVATHEAARVRKATGSSCVVTSGNSRPGNQAHNEYFLCLKDSPPVPWQQRPQYRGGLTYLDGALQALDALIGARNLTFFVTRDEKQLPRYGHDVVAVVIGDEWARPPLYADRVRATFKEYGANLTRPRFDIANPGLSLLTAMQYTRNLAARVPSAVRARASAASPSPLPVVPIPLGYFNQVALPTRPLEERDVDVSFAGSVEHEPYGRFSLRRFTGTAKSRSRAAMLRALDRFSALHPQYRCDVGVTTSYYSSANTEAENYSERLMRARICLCPRGMSLETYRYFEAMRYGCIVIAEELPDHWFYHGSPAIDVRRWELLDEILASLLSDRRRMQQLHEESLRWWIDVCSENALGLYMAQLIDPSLANSHIADPSFQSRATAFHRSTP